MQKRFLFWLASAWIILGLALWLGKSVYDSELQKQAFRRHQHLISAARTMIQEHLMVAVQDARLLSNIASELDYPFVLAPENQEKLIHKFLDSARIFGRYDQIRIIDLQGQERVRINNTTAGPVAVPTRELQNKLERYYVQHGLGLTPGEVYLSPLDLNMEQGELEEPYKPTIRLVGMIENSDGEPGGLLVLNLRASAMLNQFIALFPKGDRAMLLNSDGYWMVNHDPENEWGWMRGRPELTINEWQPDLWRSIQGAPYGSTHVKDNLFSFLRLDIANIYQHTASGRYVTDLGLVSDIHASQWITLVQTDLKGWQAGAIYLKSWFQVAIAGLFFFVLAIVALVARNRHTTLLKNQIKQEQLKNFQDLYENAPIGYITLAQEGYITNINKRAVEYLGYKREELVGRKTLGDLVDADAQEDVSTLLEKVLNSEVLHFRITMKSKNGVPLVMSCSASSRVSNERTIELSRFSLQDVTEQAKLEEQIKELARKDPLTNAANRRGFDEQAERELERARRTGAALTAISLDIDFFKKVNDTYGHDAGDEVLKALANLCARSIRQTDILARFGGEEFVILLVDTTLEQGIEKAESLRKNLEDLSVQISSGDIVRFTVSMGVATLTEAHETIKMLLQSADEALYQAKGSGRNRVCVDTAKSTP